MKRKTNLWAIILGLSVLLLTGLQYVAWAETDGVKAENTKTPLQIVNQVGIKVVAQINSSATIPNGISKQVLAVKNLFDQYSALGMTPGKDYEIDMVFRADGARLLLTDEAYDAKVMQPHPKGNPNRTLIETLHQGGVKMHECNVAMRLLGYEPKDIFPFSRVVVSGIGAVIDFEKSGYLPITP